jgi:hypothetical protein
VEVALSEIIFKDGTALIGAPYTDYYTTFTSGKAFRGPIEETYYYGSRDSIAKIYFYHNHPRATPPSKADIKLIQDWGKIWNLDLTNIEKHLIVIAKGKMRDYVYHYSIP